MLFYQTCVYSHALCLRNYLGSIGKNSTSNFTNASEWAWHVESRAWYAEVTGYTATTRTVLYIHVRGARETSVN